ncbi:MAG: hypothetical protein HQ517_15570 [SAR324 cluster bacterium]|nr:hypothetical protein [SAR324 cluster bacterium]
MDFIKDSWAGFLLLSFVLVGILQVIAKSRSTEVQPGMATKSDQFSMRTVFLSIRSGEAMLFFTVLSTTISFFFFAIGFSKYVSDVFPG